MAETNDFLGVGWKFPFEIDPETGGVAKTSDQLDGTTSAEGQRVHLSGALQQTVLTALGERFFRPEFGTRIFDLVFDPIDDTLVALMTYYVGAGVEEWEKRLQLENLNVVTEEKLGRVSVVADYKIRRTNEPGNAVFPFNVDAGVPIVGG